MAAEKILETPAPRSTERVVPLPKRSSPPSFGRTFVRRGLELIGITSFAVAQPILGVLGQHATFFVAQGATLTGIMTLVATCVLAIPVAVLALEALAFVVSRRASAVVHTVTIAILIAVALTPPLARPLGGGQTTWAVVAGSALAVGTVVYVRFPRFRQFLALIALGVPVIVGAFLFGTPVRQLIAPAPATVEPIPLTSPAPVVVLVLDELQLGSLLTVEGQVDETRYPNFAKLARTSTWFPNATTTGESTQRAIPSMLTGRWLTEKKTTPTTDHYPANLFTFLDGSMPLYANEFISRVCPANVCERVGASPGVASLLKDAGIVYLHGALPPELRERLLPPLEGNWAGFARPPEPDAGGEARSPADDHEHQQFIGWVARDNRSDQLTNFQAMVARMRKAQSPALWYVHTAFPHVPWKFLPTGQTYESERRGIPGLEGEQWIDSQAVVDHAYQRYLLQLRFTDRLLAEVITRLEGEAIFDDSLLIVTSDHGVSFRRAGSRRQFDGQNTTDLLSVPLFVKYPGQRQGAVDRRNAELVDVLPTILDVLGGRAELDGSSLRGPDPQRPNKRVFNGRTGEQVYGAQVEGVREASARIAEMFGPGGGADDIYAMGPHRALMGRAVDPGAVRAGPLTVTLEEPELFENVDANGSFVPAIVRGRLSRRTPPDVPIAVAVNGNVAALGWSFGKPGQIQLAVVVSPRYLRDGANDVQVYRISSTGQLELFARNN